MRRRDPDSSRDEDPPCRRRARPRLDPWHSSRPVGPRDPLHLYDDWEGDPGDLHHPYRQGEEVTSQLTEKQQRHLMIRGTKFDKGP
jgi:hypothetical protein